MPEPSSSSRPAVTANAMTATDAHHRDVGLLDPGGEVVEGFFARSVIRGRKHQESRVIGERLGIDPWDRVPGFMAEVRLTVAAPISLRSIRPGSSVEGVTGASSRDAGHH